MELPVLAGGGVGSRQQLGGVDAADFDDMMLLGGGRPENRYREGRYRVRRSRLDGYDREGRVALLLLLAALGAVSPLFVLLPHFLRLARADSAGDYDPYDDPFISLVTMLTSGSRPIWCRGCTAECRFS